MEDHEKLHAAPKASYTVPVIKIYKVITRVFVLNFRNTLCYYETINIVRLIVIP